MNTRLGPARDSAYATARSTASSAPTHTRRVTLAINGLYYEHSRIGLAYQLYGSRGIIDVAVDSREGTASIAFDEHRLSQKGVERLISECGYELDRRDRLGADGG